MAYRVDLTGVVCGHLSVRGLTPKVKGVRARKWICRCGACGNDAELSSSIIRQGRDTSCGCRQPLTLRGFKLVQSMKDMNQRLVKSMPKTVPDAPDVVFFLEPSGAQVDRNVAEGAIEAAALVPMQDGLFSDTAQTWVPA